jgi:ascorbate-specific PTS system EIIC-type component UlaA
VSDIHISIKEGFASMRNNIFAVIGVILIAAGALSLFYRGIPYTSSDVVIDVGPVKVNADTNKTWPVPPLLGGLAIAGGVMLIVAGVRKT